LRRREGVGRTWSQARGSPDVEVRHDHYVARGEIEVLWMGRERRRGDRCTEPWDVHTYDPKTATGWPRS
jgi:hypothetical protein